MDREAWWATVHRVAQNHIEETLQAHEYHINNKTVTLKIFKYLYWEQDRDVNMRRQHPGLQPEAECKARRHVGQQRFYREEDRGRVPVAGSEAERCTRGAGRA